MLQGFQVDYKGMAEEATWSRPRRRRPDADYAGSGHRLARAHDKNDSENSTSRHRRKDSTIGRKDDIIDPNPFDDTRCRGLDSLNLSGLCTLSVPREDKGLQYLIVNQSVRNMMSTLCLCRSSLQCYDLFRPSTRLTT